MYVYIYASYIYTLVYCNQKQNLYMHDIAPHTSKMVEAHKDP